MLVDADLLDMQRRALSVLVVDNQLPNATQRENLEGLLELLHSIEDARLDTLSNEIVLEFTNE